MLMGILFCTCLVASNLLETKVLQFGTFTLTAGVLCFPISYILNDCIAEVWGFRKARIIIWTAFLMNFLVVALGQLAVMLPVTIRVVRYVKQHEGTDVYDENVSYNPLKLSEI